MILVIIYTIISFLLDGFISNYVNINIVNPSYLETIYTIIALVVIFGYFDNFKKITYIAIVSAILFDVVYTNTFLVNVILFLIIISILKMLNEYIPNNLFTINVKSLICITFYHISTYLILLLTHFSNYPFKFLLTILLRSIIMTIIYTSISYLIIKKLYYRFYDKKIK